MEGFRRLATGIDKMPLSSLTQGRSCTCRWYIQAHQAINQSFPRLAACRTENGPEKRARNLGSRHKPTLSSLVLFTEHDDDTISPTRFLATPLSPCRPFHRIRHPFCRSLLFGNTDPTRLLPGVSHDSPHAHHPGGSHQFPFHFNRTPHPHAIHPVPYQHIPHHMYSRGPCLTSSPLTRGSRLASDHGKTTREDAATLQRCSSARLSKRFHEQTKPLHK